MRWPIGSADWNSFVECPQPEDMDRLIEHLGLEWYDPLYPPHAGALNTRLDHPGILCWALHGVRVAHVIYQPHLRFPQPIGRQYYRHHPELFRVIVDVRQDPHAEDQ